MVSKVKQWLIPIIVFVSLLITLGPFVGFFYNHEFSSITSDWGSFGDYIGGVLGVILSAIAVFLIWRTYTLQKVELTKTSESLEFQNTTQVFFKLLERKDDLVEKTILNKKPGLDFYSTFAKKAKEDFIKRKAIGRDISRIKETINATSDNHSRPIIKRYISIIQAITNLLSPSEYKDLSEGQVSNLESLTKVFGDYLTDEEKDVLTYYLWWDQYKESKNFLLNSGIIPNVFELHTD